MVEKIDQALISPSTSCMAMKLLPGFFQRQAGAVQHPVGAAHVLNLLGRKAATLEPFGVDAAGPGFVRRDGHVGRHTAG